MGPQISDQDHFLLFPVFTGHTGGQPTRLIKSDLFSFAYLLNWCPAGLPDSSNFIIQTIYRSLINTNETSGPPSLYMLFLHTQTCVSSHRPSVWVGPPHSPTHKMLEKSFIITLQIIIEHCGFYSDYKVASRGASRLNRDAAFSP